MSTEKKETKPAVKRIYVVAPKGETPRLIRATSPAVAVVHVFEPEVRVASQNDLAELLPTTKVEEA